MGNADLLAAYLATTMSDAECAGYAATISRYLEFVAALEELASIVARTAGAMPGPTPSDPMEMSMADAEELVRSVVEMRTRVSALSALVGISLRLLVDRGLIGADELIHEIEIRSSATDATAEIKQTMLAIATASLHRLGQKPS